MWARSYTLRAVLAIAFLIGFYALVLALGLGCLWFAYQLATTTRRVHVKAVLGLVCLGGLFLWSLVPRRPKWTDPGPRISESDHPRLFALIEGVARTMGLEVPSEVYLIPQVNAFVTQRGGFLGFGSRRVMAIGVPLLAIENVSQFQATIAHEFGHFAGGETRLGGLIYATRNAMIQTVENLEGTNDFLSKPFEWMLKVYLRITLAISRQQELLADSWGVRIAGKEAHLTGLKVESLHAIGLELFVDQELGPLAERGLAPANVFEGYRRFTASRAFCRIRPEIEKKVGEIAAGPYDSHPSMAERVAFAEGLEGGTQPMDPTPAWRLFDAPEKVEATFSETFRPEGAKPITWEAAVEAWGAIWREQAVNVQSRVPGLTFGSWLRVVGSKEERTRLVEAVHPLLKGYRQADREEEVRSAAIHALSIWLAAVLVQRGFSWKTSPGESLLVAREMNVIDLQDVVTRAIDGKLEPEGVRALAPDVLTDDLSLAVSQAERSAALKPASSLSFEEQDAYTAVTGPLDQFVFPACCPVCTGSTSCKVEVSIPYEGFLTMGDDCVNLEIGTCEAHRGSVKKAFRYKKKGSGTVTLHVMNRDYARLMRDCSQ